MPQWGSSRLQAIRKLTLEPERLKNRSTTARRRITGMERALPRDAPAACEFSLWMSKSSPFFHSVSVMAAILRARVRRTMVGWECPCKATGSLRSRNDRTCLEDAC